MRIHSLVYGETHVKRTSSAVKLVVWFGYIWHIFSGVGRHLFLSYCACIRYRLPLDSPAIILYILEAENIQALKIFRICT
jgi:hypothetical protein